MDKIILEDESLRDGLQFETKILSLEQKLLLFDKLRAAGLSRIQVGSFVNPKVIPQMADTDALVERLIGTPDVVVTGLVLNEKGLDRAVACGLGHISLSLSISDTHSMKNVGRSYRDVLSSVTALVKKAVGGGIAVRCGVQCAFGCVYEGAVAQDRVVEALDYMLQAGAEEGNLADTTGMASPSTIKKLVGRVKKEFPGTPLSLHLHDTRGLAVANMVAGYEAGVYRFDTSAGGLGGCPVVRGAAGNIATEDAVYLFGEMGVDTGIDLEKVCQVTGLYEEMLDRNLPGHMSKVLNSMKNCDV